MLVPMTYSLLLLIWLAWGTQAVLSALQVRKYARRLERPRRDLYENHRPPAAVIVPFKGLEPALEDNLQSLCTQDYPDYHLLLVVESEADPAYPLLQQAAARFPDRGIAVIVAGRAGPSVGQKVHNQLKALEHLEHNPGREQVLVFADSDAVPGSDWLGNLVGPLVKDEIGVTTGYRWLVPETGTDPTASDSSPTVWAKLASVMNSSVACFAGRDAFNQAWGGSMAIRLDTAREGDLVGSLRGCITDDYPLSQLARRLGKRVYFVPRCLVASPVNFTFAQLLNFAHRQYLITRVYAPHLYLAAITLPLLYLLGFTTAWAVLLVALMPSAPDAIAPIATVWPFALAAMVTVTVANHCRATFRRNAIRNAFSQPMVDQLRPTLRLDRWATILCLTFHWLLIARAAFGQTMRWRGINYKISGPQKVCRLDET